MRNLALKRACRLLACATVTMTVAHVAEGQISCPRSRALPAYSHNDYQNRRPLHEALRLGYRGVEADLVLREGELRVAHSGVESKRGRTLETMYLQPLRAILKQCGRVPAPAAALILNLELKERSRAAYDSLLAVVARYPDLFEAPSPGRMPPVETILVGWSPPAAEAMTPLENRLHRQYKITRRTQRSAPVLPESVRLISLDYGNSIRWSGRGPVPQNAARWLEHVRTVKGVSARHLARAYNVPANAAVYRLLLEGGIDLIGTEDLEATHRLLHQVGSVHSR